MLSSSFMIATLPKGTFPFVAYCCTKYLKLTCFYYAVVLDYHKRLLVYQNDPWSMASEIYYKEDFGKAFGLRPLGMFIHHLLTNMTLYNFGVTQKVQHSIEACQAIWFSQNQAKKQLPDIAFTYWYTYCPYHGTVRVKVWPFWNNGLGFSLG